MTSQPVKHEQVSHCHNCGAAVDYHYCALCGQGTALHVPSAGEFVHEFVGHYVAVEGRLWKTLALLLFKPGMLTAEYIAGRRARYVQPLRVYLTLSILFFALLKVIGPQVANFDGVKKGNQEAEASAVVVTSGIPIGDRYLRAIAENINTFIDKPAAERNQLATNGFFAYVPYAMFCLMPLFALYLKLLYMGSGRYYGEHLLFALHANGFAFAMFSIMILISKLDIGLISFLLVLWLVIYLPKAMRRVYGGSLWSTGARWLVLSGLHLCSMALALVAVAGLAIMH
ncbi:MAG: DUF3667 domain-containing protein [Pseudomonadota bacterium]